MIIDTSILAILYEKKSLKMWKRLYIARSVRRTVWNTNDDKYSNFGHFYEKKSSNFDHFYSDISWFWSFLNVETSLYTDVSTFLDFAFLFENVQTSL